MASPPLRNDWFHRAPDVGGMQRFEAFFAGHGYEMHRHDTYAIGHTLSGVQRFQYHGGWRHSLPGGRSCCTRMKPTTAKPGPRTAFNTG